MGYNKPQLVYEALNSVKTSGNGRRRGIPSRVTSSKQRGHRYNAPYFNNQ